MHTIADHAKDWLTLAMAGLGITFLPHEFIGGLFLALAAAAFAMRIEPEQDQRELWLVMLGAFLAAYLAAECLQYAVRRDWIEPISPQLVMMAAGFFSRHIMRFLLRLGGLIEARSGDIAEAVVDRVLPDERKDSSREDPK